MQQLFSHQQRSKSCSVSQCPPWCRWASPHVHHMRILASRTFTAAWLLPTTLSLLPFPLHLLHVSPCRPHFLVHFTSYILFFAFSSQSSFHITCLDFHYTTIPSFPFPSHLHPVLCLLIVLLLTFFLVFLTPIIHLFFPPPPPLPRTASYPPEQHPPLPTSLHRGYY